MNVGFVYFGYIEFVFGKGNWYFGDDEFVVYCVLGEIDLEVVVFGVYVVQVNCFECFVVVCVVVSGDVVDFDFECQV